MYAPIIGYSILLDSYFGDELKKEKDSNLYMLVKKGVFAQME